MELIQGGVFEGVGIDEFKDFVGALEQFQAHPGLEAGDFAGFLLVEFVAEVGFDGAPFLEGFGGNVELAAGGLEVAVILVDLVEGVDFGVEGVAVFHEWCPFGKVIQGRY